MLLDIISDCGDSSVYKTIKLILSFLAPGITIFAALLGLFTKTTVRETVIKNNIQVETEKFTTWAWWSLSGIMLGFFLGIGSVLNDHKIEIIETCETHNRQAIYEEKMANLKNQLEESQNALSGILKSAQKTSDKLNSTYESQVKVLQMGYKIAQKTEEIVHPLWPLTIQYKFYINLEKSCNDTLNALFNRLTDLREFLPAYIKTDNQELNISLYSIYDKDKNIEKYIVTLLKIYHIIPQLTVRFYKNGGKENILRNADAYYEIFNEMPSYDYDQAQIQKLYADDIKIEFHYNPKSHDVIGYETVVPKEGMNNDNKFKSLYTIQKGCMTIELNGGWICSSKQYKSSLQYISFHCGTGNPDIYAGSVDKSAIIKVKNSEFYYSTIKQLLEY